MVYFENERLADRIAAVYRELPTMRLTARQAAKLLSMPVSQIEPVLKLLVVEGRLQVTADGLFARPPIERRRSGAGPEAAERCA